jgi:hypothetical protein
MDLLGRPVTPSEERLLDLYREVKELLAQPDLSPAVAANLRQALACCWNIVNDLDLVFEQVYDFGV